MKLPPVVPRKVLRGFRLESDGSSRPNYVTLNHLCLNEWAEQHKRHKDETREKRKADALDPDSGNTKDSKTAESSSSPSRNRTRKAPLAAGFGKLSVNLSVGPEDRQYRDLLLQSFSLRPCSEGFDPSLGLNG